MENDAPLIGKGGAKRNFQPRCEEVSSILLNTMNKKKSVAFPRTP